MIIAGETKRFRLAPKEQVPKNPWDPISQVKAPRLDASLESACKGHQRGILRIEVKLSGNRTEEGRKISIFPLSFFVLSKKQHGEG